MKGGSKTRGDAVLDTQLEDKEQEEFFLFAENTTLVNAKQHLKAEYKIDVSINTIGRWLEKVRKGKADNAFYRLIGEIKDDSNRAETFAKEIGSKQKLVDATVVMLAQMLFRARRSNDPAAMKQSAQLLSTIIGAVSSEKAATASVISAETQRSRFQFDAAKAALANAAELQTIQKSKGSEREKVERAVTTLFGKKPEKV